MPPGPPFSALVGRGRDGLSGNGRVKMAAEFAGTVHVASRQAHPRQIPPPPRRSPLWGDISEKLLVLKMRRFAAGVVVAAIASGVEGLLPLVPPGRLRQQLFGVRRLAAALHQPSSTAPAQPGKGRSGGHKPSGGGRGRAPGCPGCPAWPAAFRLSVAPKTQTPAGEAGACSRREEREWSCGRRGVVRAAWPLTGRLEGKPGLPS